MELAIASLRRAPAVYDALLRGRDEAEARLNEGDDTWSAFDIVGHLIHCEETDWLPRAKILLEHGEARPFEPFDRFAQMGAPKAATLDAELDLFAEWRARTVDELVSLDLGSAELERTGTHPELGRVTLGELISAWTTHDLVHVRQVSRVLAKAYRGRVGVWAAYLPVLDER
ncbi:MAG: DinB family protein [Planctomycetota bacterium]